MPSPAVFPDLIANGEEMRKPVQSRIEYFLFMCLYHTVKHFPLSVIKKTAAALMQFGGTVLGIRRKIAEQNLELIFPQMDKTEKKRIMRGMYREMGKNAAEVYFADFEELYKDVILEGWENLEEAFALNKGVILASAHTGNWELAGRFIHTRHKLSVIYKKLRNRYLNDFTYSLRSNDGLVMIELKNALRQILKLLKDKYIVTIMIDQNARRNGVQTMFLGHPASTHVGCAKIAIKTQTPIVPALALRTEEDKHKFIFEKMILPEGYRNTTEDIIALTEEVSAQLEKYILQHPEQWFWVHRRWRSYRKAKTVDKKTRMSTSCRNL